MDRAVISRRLKAARWLAGDGRNARNQLVPLSAADLAQREPLARNRITASRIEEIEQERVDAREMELEKIADALGLPRSWFLETSIISDARLREAANVLAQLPALADRVRDQGQGQEPGAGDEQGRPPGEAGGAGG